jgi:hypothetical protein
MTERDISLTQDHDAREVMFVHAGHRHNVSDIAWNHDCPWLISSVSDAEENIQVRPSVSFSMPVCADSVTRVIVSEHVMTCVLFLHQVMTFILFCISIWLSGGGVWRVSVLATDADHLVKAHGGCARCAIRDFDRFRRRRCRVQLLSCHARRLCRGRAFVGR